MKYQNGAQKPIWMKPSIMPYAGKSHIVKLTHRQGWNPDVLMAIYVLLRS
jgi:hypothetical protein